MRGWRQMRAADLPAVAAISDAVHGRYTEDVAIYAGRLALYPAGCRVFEVEGAVAGYLIAHPWRSASPPGLGERPDAIPDDADTYYFHDLALLPAARGTGAGRTAVMLAERQAREAGFGDITLMAVNGADSFWAAQGFIYVGGGEASYGEGAYLMRRPVKH